MTRLARYRQLLARIEPTDPTDFAGRPEIYVRPPSALPHKLATALALQPASSHLVVGPIGSGKTTTLRRAVDALRTHLGETGDHAEYIDVSAEHQLNTERLPGVLIALAGRVLIRQVPARARRGRAYRAAVTALEKHTHGYDEWLHPDDFTAVLDALESWAGEQDPSDAFRLTHPGALKAPAPTSPMFSHLVEPLTTLRDGLGHSTILFFDSLDRLEDSARFQEAIVHDLPVLKRAGIGVVVVGPTRFALSKDRSVVDLFDEIHVVQAANAETVEGVAFLSQVLRSRASAEMLPDEVITSIARSSGGILRDLLSIATRAARDAYDRGHDQLTLSDAKDAAHAIGAGKAVGLDASSLELLVQVAAGEPFVLDERRLPLVERSQVVQTDPGQWRVHPALRMYLESPSKAA
jgi:Cdc6-like AAA superfamily ATPase